MEHHAGCAYRDDFFEYTANAQCDHGRAFQKGKLGRNHAEGEHTGEDQKHKPKSSSMSAGEGLESVGDLNRTFNGESDENKGKEHDRC